MGGGLLPKTVSGRQDSIVQAQNSSEQACSRGQRQTNSMAERGHMFVYLHVGVRAVASPALPHCSPDTFTCCSFQSGMHNVRVWRDET